MSEEARSENTHAAEAQLGRTDIYEAKFPAGELEAKEGSKKRAMTELSSSCRIGKISKTCRP